MIRAFFGDLYLILGKKLIILVCLVLIFSSLVALLEAVSIGSVALFVGIIIEPEKFLGKILNYDDVKFIIDIEIKKRVLIGSLLLLLIFLLKNSLNFISNYLNSKLAKDIKIHISKNMFNSYINRNYYFHLLNNPSKLWHNLTGEINNVCHFYILAQQLIVSSFMIAGIIGLIILASDFLFLTIFIFLSLIVILIYNFFKKKIHFKSQQRLFFETSISKIINQALGSIKETKIFKIENWFKNNFEKSLVTSENQKFYLTIINSFPRIILEIFSIISLLLIFNYLIFQNKTTTEILPFLTLISLSIIRMVPIFTLISTNINSIKFLNLAKKIVIDEFKFLKKSNLEFNKNEKRKGNSLLNFKYSKKKTIFTRFNLNINAKDRVLFVGPSGSGKSTIVNIILGLLNPTKGNIFINEIDLKYVKNIWQKKIGYMPQDVYLLDDTIKKNITFISKRFDKNLFIKALKQSKLDKELKKFSNGINTKIGHRGKKLSGGQKQRLALARALYRNPEILIMDEPTSSLDENSEKKIIEEFFQATKELTIIMVAHRAKKFKHKFNKIIKLN